MPWQTDDAVGFRSWGFIPNEQYKSAQYLITNLVDIVSKNGNLLLNIGPRSDGTIPEEQQKLLLSMGDWLSVNGEAIYGTRPWKIFGEGPTEVVGGSFGDSKMKPFTDRDIRFTSKGDSLYAIVLDIPKKGSLITTLSSVSSNGKVESVELLGSQEKIAWSQKAEGLFIKPLQQYPTAHAIVYRIRFRK